MFVQKTSKKQMTLGFDSKGSLVASPEAKKSKLSINNKTNSYSGHPNSQQQGNAYTKPSTSTPSSFSQPAKLNSGSSTSRPSVIDLTSGSSGPLMDISTRRAQAATPQQKTVFGRGGNFSKNYETINQVGASIKQDYSGNSEQQIQPGSGNSTSKQSDKVSFASLTQDRVLSKEQMSALELVLNKKTSVFITGSAGTGKSVLLTSIIRELTKKYDYDPSAVAITAPTGIAAFQIGGITLHSWAGVGLGTDTFEKLRTNINRRKPIKNNWLNVQVLIIDEVSMLDVSLFEKLEQLARHFRNSTKPFGGIQLVLTGDFYQLPPVEKRGENNSKSGFVFESELWSKVIKKEIILTRVFRQRDLKFVDILNEIRLGSLSADAVRLLRSLSRVPNYPDDGIRATELFSLRHQVDEANRRSLALLPGPSHSYHSANTVHGEITTGDDILSKLDNACKALRRIDLKVNAQVMLINNMPERNLVNGSRGVVVGFEEMNGSEYPVCKFINGVQFTVAPEEYEVELSGKKYKRIQLPLILAWALSIHKSQGQTIERLKVDIGTVFEKGQAYVALSRATSLDGLQVLNFDATKVFAHKKVRDFYARLARSAY